MTNSAEWESYKRTLSTGSAFASAVAILELDEHGPVLKEARGRLERFRPDGAPELNWDQWVEVVEEQGRGWSSGEWRLFDIAAALASNRPLRFWGTLDSLGDRLDPVLQIVRLWSVSNY